MENQASTGEETHTEEGATATPPGNEINYNQFLHSYFQYPGIKVPYVEGQKMDWTIDNALHSRFIRWKLNVKTSLTANLLSFKRVLNAKK